MLLRRPSTPRRAYELGDRSRSSCSPTRHPEVDIHLYGEPVGPAAVPRRPTTGLLTPEQLNELYNRCVAGLVLSATNVSLVPHEMLAAGCIPVVNDAEHNRIVLDNDHVVYAPATPFDLADALSALVERPPAERAAAAAAAARSVRGRSWARPASRSSGSCAPSSRPRPPPSRPSGAAEAAGGGRLCRPAAADASDQQHREAGEREGDEEGQHGDLHADALIDDLALGLAELLEA